MKKIIITALVALSLSAASCDPTPGCFPRTDRYGNTIIECR